MTNNENALDQYSDEYDVELDHDADTQREEFAIYEANFGCVYVLKAKSRQEAIDEAKDIMKYRNVEWWVGYQTMVYHNPPHMLI